MPDSFTVTDRRRVPDEPVPAVPVPFTPLAKHPSDQGIPFAEDWVLHAGSECPQSLFIPGVDYSKLTAMGVERVRLTCSKCDAWQWHPGSSMNKARQELLEQGWVYWKGDDYCPSCRPAGIQPTTKELKDAVDGLPKLPAYLASTAGPTEPLQGIPDEKEK